MNHGFPWQRLGLLLLAFLSLAVQWFTTETLHQQRISVEDLLEDTPLFQVFPSLRHNLRREVDPLRQKLLAAKAWLALSFEPGRLNQLEQRAAMEAASRVPEYLEKALLQAREVLKARPGSGEAATVVAGLTYQTAVWRQRQPMFVGAWEPPLALALKLSPADPENLLVAAVIVLGGYAELEPPQRSAALELIRRAMEDPHNFRVLFSRWSEVAETTDEWLAPVPHHSWAWRLLADQARAQRQYAWFCQFYSQSQHLVRQELQTQLDEAARWLQGRDPTRARGLVLGVLHNLPVAAENATLLIKAFELMPPGPLPLSLTPSLRGWLNLAAWYAVLGQELLPPATVQRLSLGLVADDVPGLATARLLSGDRLGAEALERRQEALNTEPWADYVLTKVAWLLHRGETSQAQGLLQLLPPARQKLASAQNLFARISSRQATLERVSENDGCLGFGPLPPFCFRVTGNSWWVEVLLAKPSSHLNVLWEAADVSGALELLADGHVIACLESKGGSNTKVALKLAPGLHRLELRPLVGRARPAELWLEPAE